MDTDKRFKIELDHYRLKYDLYEKLPCIKEEDKAFNDLLKRGKRLPEGIYRDYDWRNTNDSEFYRIAHSDVNQADIMEYLMYKKLDMLKTIKNCVIFFTVSTVILLVFLILLLGN